MTLTVIFVVLFSATCFGQNPPPPPPPPLIYSAPKKSEIKRVEYGIWGFSIDVAGSLKQENIESESSQRTDFSSYRKGSNVKVSVRNYSRPEGVYDLSPEMERIKNIYLLASENTKTYEKVIPFEGGSSVEFGFTFSGGMEYARVRLIRARYFIYVLYLDVTNWHILNNHSKDKVIEFNTEADRFFDSFKHIGLTIKGSSDVAVIPSPSVTKPPVKKAKKRDLYSRRFRRFTSGEGAFKVGLSARPKRRVNQLEQPFGKSDFIIYSLPTRFAHYAVTYFDTPAIVTGEAYRALNLERQKQGILTKIKGSKLLSERKAKMSGFEGMEYKFSQNGNTTLMRVIFVKQRLFRVLITTRGIDGKLGKRTARFNRTLRKKFFDSFVVTKLPEPKYKSVELPKDFEVFVNAKSFRSDYFGIQMNLNDNLEILNSFESRFLKDVTSKAIDEENGKHKSLLKESLENSKIIFLAYVVSESGSDESQNDNPAEETQKLILISVESSDYPVFDPVQGLKTTMEIGLEPTEKIVSTAKREIINGIEFGWYETYDSRDKLYQRIYMANLKDLAFQIYFNYETEQELTEMLKMVKSIKSSEKEDESN